MGRIPKASSYWRKTFIISKLDKYIERYGLKIVSIKKVDLRDTYLQYLHNSKLDDLLTVDGSIDRSMLNSPHFELAHLYYDHGKKWLMKHYKDTKYFQFKNNVLNRTDIVPLKKIGVFDSIRDGYPKKGHEKDYVVLLNEPLIHTRFNVKHIPLNSLEVFIGHHRIAALLALGINEVKVIIAEDIKKGTCDIYGKLSDNYRKAL